MSNNLRKHVKLYLATGVYAEGFDAVALTVRILELAEQIETAIGSDINAYPDIETLRKHRSMAYHRDVFPLVEYFFTHPEEVNYKNIAIKVNDLVYLKSTNEEGWDKFNKDVLKLELEDDCN